jgi:Clp amino terminal domain, pathogenicity island component
VTDGEQLRLDADLLTVLRAGVSHALEHGAEFVAPAHLLLGLLAHPVVGPAIAPLVPREKIEKAAAAAPKPPQLADVADGAPADGAAPPFARYESLAFRSRDGARTLYLDAESYRLFIEGARRAVGVYRAKHLVYGFAAEAVKDRDLLSLFGADPHGVSKAVEGL